jgi:hypothetical protein
MDQSGFFRRCGIAAVALLLAWAAPAGADHQKVVGATVVNIGIVPVDKAVRDSTEAARHSGAHPAGSQHLLVSLSDARSGRHIADAKVTAVVLDPSGRTQKKVLVAASSAGVPDYSEVFYFGNSGKYRIRLTIELPGVKSPLSANFNWTHEI